MESICIKTNRKNVIAKLKDILIVKLQSPE